MDGLEDGSVSGEQILCRDRAVDSVGQFHILVEDTGNAETSYVDSSVSAGGSYAYRVKARNAGGLSVWSSYARADTRAALDES